MSLALLSVVPGTRSCLIGCGPAVRAAGAPTATRGRGRVSGEDGEGLPIPSITRRLVEDFCRRPAPDGGAAETTRQLTGRELDVVKLVAQGLSNTEIAGRLYLSDATVKSHIARVLAKLGLRDRVQVVVLAYETGIVRPSESG